MMDFEKAVSVIDKAKDSIDLLKFWEFCYRKGQPKVSDEVWDKIIEKYKYKELVGDASCSAAGRKFIRMHSPHVSLCKTNINKFEAAMSKTKGPISMSSKLDGVCGILQYSVQEDGSAKLIHIGTIGNGFEMLECFPDAFTNVERDFPDTLPSSTVSMLRDIDAVFDDDIIEICGEYVISTREMATSTPRNTVAGIVNRKNPTNLDYFNTIAARGEDPFKAFKIANKIRKTYGAAPKLEGGRIVVDGKDVTEEVISCEKEVVHFGVHSISTKKGTLDSPAVYEALKGYFTLPLMYNSIQEFLDDIDNAFDYSYFRVNVKKEDVQQIIEVLDIYNGYVDGIEYRKKGRFVCDGIVFKDGEYDEGAMRTNIIAHHPTNRFAVKLPSPGIETEILDIYYETTKLGNETAHGKIKPISFDGTTIENINMFNRKWVEERDFHIGDKIKVIMSADLIPVIEKVE